MAYLELIAGLALLTVGADMFVRGAVAVARRLGLPPLLIGLTLVGFGTSLPELVASLEAARVGSPGIAVGNVVGSNIANILLILGLAAVISPIAVAPAALRRDGVVLVASCVLVIAAALSGEIERAAGALFLALLLAYTLHSYVSERRNQMARARLRLAEGAVVRSDPPTLWRALALTLGGLPGIVLGAGLLIESAIALAASFGIAETTIGLTVVALGTSLPELAVSLVAALRRHVDVALGNIVGSNVFNVFGILGLTALYSPLAVPAEIVRLDAWVLLAVTGLMIVFAATGARLERWEGATLLSAYVAYLGVLAVW